MDGRQLIERHAKLKVNKLTTHLLLINKLSTHLLLVNKFTTHLLLLNKLTTYLVLLFPHQSLQDLCLGHLGGGNQPLYSKRPGEGQKLLSRRASDCSYNYVGREGNYYAERGDNREYLTERWEGTIRNVIEVRGDDREC